MAYEVSGSVDEIKEPQTFASGFTKRELILTVQDGKYDQTVVFEFLQDSVSKLDDIKEGDSVSVTFDLRGRRHNDRVFNSLVGWKISVDSKAESSAPQNENPIPSFGDQVPDGELDTEPPF
jgi:single-strand DNA-binding protein